MIGLPRETDDDVVAIADLCLRVRETGPADPGRPRAARLQLNVSVNNFIPKPFTPFQWAAMADRETLRRRQDLLRARLRKPGIRLALPRRRQELPGGRAGAGRRGDGRGDRGGLEAGAPASTPGPSSSAADGLGGGVRRRRAPSAEETGHGRSPRDRGRCPGT